MITIDTASIIKDILTWATAAKVVVGGALVHIWNWIKAKFATVETDVKAEVKKL